MICLAVPLCAVVTVAQLVVPSVVPSVAPFVAPFVALFVAPSATQLKRTEWLNFHHLLTLLHLCANLVSTPSAVALNFSWTIQSRCN